MVGGPADGREGPAQIARLQVLSLGAGWQSSALLLMSAEGDLPKLDAAIFADTRYEASATYAYLNEVLEPAATAAGIDLYRPSKGDLRARSLAPEGRAASLPVYVRKPDGSRRGQVRRQCTGEYKIEAVRSVTWPLHKDAGRPGVDLWLGMSWDEVDRMTTSDRRYIDHVYPLVDARLSRDDCRRWIVAHGYPPPPRSACIGCPLASDARWQELRDTDPEAWADAVAFDRELREAPAPWLQRLSGEAYLHSSLLPLDEVVLTDDDAPGRSCGVCAT